MSEGEDDEEYMEIADNDDQFMRLLGSEIDKVTAFYVAKASQFPTQQSAV